MATDHPHLLEELEHTMEKLDFGDVLGMVAGHALSQRSAERILSERLLPSRDVVERSQEAIAEVVSMVQNGEDMPLSGWTDSAPFLAAINFAGTVAGCEELRRISEAEKKAGEVGRFLSKSVDRYPSISRMAAGISLHREVVDSIDKTVGPDFTVFDGASPGLARIRRQLLSMKNSLRKDFAEYADRHAGGKGYEFVTLRGERFVVSIPRSEASHIRGIVHQASGSGASLYLEPLEFVERNNQLENVLMEEGREVARILGALTDEVLRNKQGLQLNQDTLRDLDVVSAKARFASRFRCTRPAHSADGSMVLREARHPLLEKRLSQAGSKITGLDISMGPELCVLVISGPNAGGKTVALKTIGMVVLMDRSGLLVPCLDGSVIPDYNAVYADIGDDQSIERSLSTFSSRIERISRILGLAARDSLVLIDEIGDGTDPEEGAALACAVLDELCLKSARTIVTTHMSALKGWAHGRDGAENATLEFDAERLQPLFRMRMGVPGRSWGIEMAGRFGIPGGIVKRARDWMSRGSLQLEDLLAHLEKMEGLLEHKRKELLSREAELSKLVSSYREHLDAFERERDEMVRQARKEALGIVTSTRVEMEKMVRDIRIAQADRKVIRTSKELLKERKSGLERDLVEKRVLEPIDPADLVRGLDVVVMSLGKEGRVIEADGSGRVFVELPGGLRVETREDDLSPAEKRKERRLPGVSVSWSSDGGGPVSTELMIRGMERAEAMEQVDAFIDRAVLQGLETVTIIHGVGKGILRHAVYDMLRKDPRVAEVNPGEPALGGDGVAIVRLK